MKATRSQMSAATGSHHIYNLYWMNGACRLPSGERAKSPELQNRLHQPGPLLAFKKSGQTDGGDRLGLGTYCKKKNCDRVRLVHDTYRVKWMQIGWYWLSNQLLCLNQDTKFVYRLPESKAFLLNDTKLLTSSYLGQCIYSETIAAVQQLQFSYSRISLSNPH